MTVTQKVKVSEQVVVTSTANEKDAERWREIKRRFDAAKSSESDRILYDLGFDAFQFDDLQINVDNAIKAQKEKT